jgi:alkylation response protein AidB-like acyl-CoA dehydrogenase
LGILGATLPEECGGSGADQVAALLVMSALGRNLVISPYVSTVACAATLLARVGTTAQRERYLPAIIGGSSIVAFACDAANGASCIDALQACASPVAGGFEVDGYQTAVVGGAWSDHIIVTARIEAEDGAVGAFILPVDAPGLQMRHARTIDGGSASTIHLRKAFVPEGSRIGERRDIGEAIDRVHDEATAMLCADAAGSMDALLHATVEYARTRKQFGRAIGSFQALQHRMVDMLLACEQASSITHRAVSTLDGEPVERRAAVSAAKALVGKAGRMVAQAAVQIHGGIGITDELDVSHHFRRIEMFNLQFGTVDQHVRRYADLLDAQRSPSHAC